MRLRFIETVLIISIIIFFTGCAFLMVHKTRETDKKTVLDLALKNIFLQREDLKTDMQEDMEEPFLLNNACMCRRYPLKSIALSKNIESRILKASDISSLVLLGADLIETPIVNTDLPAMQSKGPLSLKQAQDRLYNSLVIAEKLFNEAFSETDENDIQFLKEKVRELLFKGRYLNGPNRHKSQYLTEKAFNIASAINRKKIITAAVYIALAIDNVEECLREKDYQSDLIHDMKTPLGMLVIGSSSNDTYDGEMPAILIDPGGDDTYRFKTHSRFSIILDLKGNDTYISSNQSYLASGILGIGFLVDLGGNDIYEGKNFSLGCGFIGTGVLADLNGNDSYDAGMFCEGAAFMGTGILYDKTGNDHYQCSLYGQGIGYVGGSGILVDMHGNDRLAAGGVIPDLREKEDAFQTYSQGFGLGCRQFAGGGTGLLYNGDGDDTYTGSYFCQGSSYWHALGILIDNEGNDSYTARRYSQGAGIHSSAAILLDNSGNDTYTSWGVSQGCGHDLAGGILYDGNGNDRYEAEWLSQGAGNSSGMGILIDNAGSDTYGKGANNSIQGSGVYDERRDSESMGILIDRQGQDNFSSPPAGQEKWKKRLIGSGIDYEGQIPSVWHETTEQTTCSVTKRAWPEKETAYVPWKTVLPGLESLLPTKESWHKAAENIAEKGPSVIPTLLQYSTIKDICVRRAVEECLKEIGRKNISSLHDYLTNNSLDPSEKEMILYVLGDIGNTRSEGIFYRFLASKKNSIRAMALRGLYKIHMTAPVQMYPELAEAEDSSIRKFFCLSLSDRSDNKSMETLCNMLSDKNFQVRHAAYRILKKKPAAAAPFLERLLNKKNQPDITRDMAYDILGLKQN